MDESAEALVLAEALAAIDAGEDIRIVVDRYPALKEQLLSYVEIAQRLRGSRDAAPMPPFPAESLRRRLRAEGAI
jgi:hypothetical protein